MIMVDAQIWDVKNVFEVLFSDVVNVILFRPSPLPLWRLQMHCLRNVFIQTGNLPAGITEPCPENILDHCSGRGVQP